MTLRNALALLSLALIAQTAIAKDRPTCPDIEQIKQASFVETTRNSMGELVIISAPFQANNITWKVSFVYYGVPTNLASAQRSWNEAVIVGPWNEFCMYYTESDTINWIGADVQY